MLEISDGAGGACAVLRLNRPEALNALNGEMLDAIDAALDAIERDSQRRALIFCGTGRAFCAGADLKEQVTIERLARMHRLVMRLQNFPKISIAAIEGFALGGGLELAMACTFRVAGPAASLGLPEIRMNVMPGYGGTQLLPRLTGPGFTLEMLLSGEPVDAQRALRAGLLNAVAAAPGGAMALAEDMAARCSRHALEAQQAIRAVVTDGMRLPLEQALALELRTVERIAQSDGAREAIENFRRGGRH